MAKAQQPWALPRLFATGAVRSFSPLPCLRSPAAVTAAHPGKSQARLHHVPAKAWETEDGPHGAACIPLAQPRGEVPGRHRGLQNTRNTLTLATTNRLDARKAWEGCLLL